MVTAQPSLPLLLLRTIITVTAWFALILQYLLHTGTLTNFFSYFTILGNLLIAVALTGILILPEHYKAKRFLASASVQTALALYIAIVALVYNAVLRGIWAPKGWQLLADNLLHVIVPVLYMLYWYRAVPKGSVRWRDSIRWLLIPLVYLVYTLVRGPLTGWYPYPFLNVGVLGFTTVLLNAGAVLLAFAIVAALLLLLKRSAPKHG